MGILTICARQAKASRRSDSAASDVWSFAKRCNRKTHKGALSYLASGMEDECSDLDEGYGGDHFDLDPLELLYCDGKTTDCPSFT